MNLSGQLRHYLSLILRFVQPFSGHSELPPLRPMLGIFAALTLVISILQSAGMLSYQLSNLGKVEGLFGQKPLWGFAFSLSWCAALLVIVPSRRFVARVTGSNVPIAEIAARSAASALPLLVLVGINGIFTSLRPLNQNTSSIELLLRTPIWLGLPIVGVIWDAAIWNAKAPNQIAKWQAPLVWGAWLIPVSVVFTILFVLSGGQ